MPSIEILCVGLSATKPMPETSFAVLCDPSRQSHRGPTPRFQADFDQLGGVLYHIGNAELAGEPDGSFFAYDILSEASRGADPRSFLELAPARATAELGVCHQFGRENELMRLLNFIAWGVGCWLLLACSGSDKTTCQQAHDKLEGCQPQIDAGAAKRGLRVPLSLSADCSGDDECLAECLAPASCGAIVILSTGSSTDPNEPPVEAPDRKTFFDCFQACIAK